MTAMAKIAHHSGLISSQRCLVQVVLVVADSYIVITYLLVGMIQVTRFVLLAGGPLVSRSGLVEIGVAH